jgi:uncharacterized protein YyaL (SSP411 family)
MANRLEASCSPYLLQHAHNPVDWYPWGEEALEKARAENKPIFLSIGYSACHWCRVMARESFEDQKVADIMNKLFVNIKVDREERPDIDAFAMNSVVLMTGKGGWPTSVWLTPDLKPFYGGTYFPPTPRSGQPSFAQILLLLASGWRDRRDQVIGSAEELMGALGRLSEVAASSTEDSPGWLEGALAVCRAQYDEQAGGFGGAPKFPHAMTLRFLLTWAVSQSDRELLSLVEHSAEEMARGGIHDQLGGGFHRYSVDSDWTVPHFEKMLCDNALMLGLYSDLTAHTGQPLYRSVAADLVDWLEREMTLPHGGFACSQASASGQAVPAEGQEGQYFVWTPSQLEELEKAEQKVFSRFYGVTAEGNYPGGASVLTRRMDPEELAREMWLQPEGLAELLKSARSKALEIRSRRPAPTRDDKALASWNGQAVSALCQAARLAQLPKAEAMARRAGEFLLAHFTQPGTEGELPRLVLSERAQGVALAEDVASLCLAFFDLHELTVEEPWLAQAQLMYKRLIADYWDEEKGLTAMSCPRGSDLPLRPYSFEDNATPSAHSLLLECARRHHRLTGDAASQALWRKALDRVAAAAQRAPTGLGLALQSAALATLDIPAGR